VTSKKETIQPVVRKI